MKYNCVDGFSGAGGLGLGLQRSGMRIRFSFDNDVKCVETINLNTRYFDHRAVCADAESLVGGKILSLTGLKRGNLFLMAGGPPCQGFSIQRRGNDVDVRNDLVLTYGRLIQETFPLFFIMENVSGIRGSRGLKILTQLKKEMESDGYVVHEKLLDAQDYGVPQRRKRIVLVGERKDFGCSYRFPVPSKDRHTVRETIAFLPAPPPDGTDHPEVPLHRRDRLSEINKRRLRALKPGQGRDSLPAELLADCHKIDSSVIGHRNVYGRMEWDDVAPTITAKFDSFTRGQFGHPEQLRSISLREGALLQTFPPDFMFSGTKVEIARQIGNAVPPLLAEALGKSIIDYYEKNK